MLQEFKKFALRGNLVDLAVGFIMGVAFAAITTSLVNNIIMPPIGYLLGNVNFNDLFVVLGGQHYASLADAQAAGAPVVAYGIFINTILNFIIIAIIMFLLVRAMNRMQAKEKAPAAAPTTKDCPYCHTTIPLAATRCPNCTSQLPAAE